VFSNWLASGAFCRLCISADHPHPSFPIGTPCPAAHGLPTHPHRPGETNSINPTTATDSRVTEIVHRTENDQDLVEEDGECEEEVEREPAQICLYLGKKWHASVAADMCQDSTENWIPEKLLGHWDDVIEPGDCTVVYQAAGGIRLESRGRVKVDYRLCLSGKTFPGVLFQVYASRPSRTPGIILGRSWAQTHGATVSLSRRLSSSKDYGKEQGRPVDDRHTDPRWKKAGSHASASVGNRIMKLSQRHGVHHKPQISR
jgi:hypothetical protein